MIFRTTISNQKPHPLPALSTREGEKSRRDGILLTVGFNLRTNHHAINNNTKIASIIAHVNRLTAGMADVTDTSAAIVPATTA